MATRNVSGHQGQVKDPEHDGRLKGHHGGEAPKAHAEGTHKDQKGHAEPKHAEPRTAAAAKTHEAEAKHEGTAKTAPAKPHREPAHAEPPKAAATSDDADLKAREYTDAEGNVHHHTKKYMESHKA